MITRKATLATLLGLAMGISSASYAACTSPQLTGTWEAAFSDGNSCRLKIKSNGQLDAANSVCYDPDRGTTVPDSGVFKPKANCFIEGELVIGGFSVEVPVQVSQGRGVAAGRYRVDADGTKGSVFMVRVP